MPQYIAIVEDAGPDNAVGVWFPDLPGCFSAGDTLEEAMANAPAAIAVYAESLEEEGKDLPPPRSFAELKRDDSFRTDISGNMVALIAGPDRISTAAE